MQILVKCEHTLYIHVQFKRYLMSKVVLDEHRKQALLEVVKKALLDEGFEDTRLQFEEPTQAFGLIKKLMFPWEMHIRGYCDGSLASEIEVSREYLEHLNNQYRFFATKELIDILEKYEIPYRLIGKNPQPVPLEEIAAPETLTLWEPILKTKGLLALLGTVGIYIKTAYDRFRQS